MHCGSRNSWIVSYSFDARNYKATLNTLKGTLFVQPMREGATYEAFFSWWLRPCSAMCRRRFLVICPFHATFGAWMCITSCHCGFCTGSYLQRTLLNTIRYLIMPWLNCTTYLSVDLRLQNYFEEKTQWCQIQSLRACGRLALAGTRKVNSTLRIVLVIPESRTYI